MRGWVLCLVCFALLCLQPALFLFGFEGESILLNKIWATVSRNGHCQQPRRVCHTTPNPLCDDGDVGHKEQMGGCTSDLVVAVLTRILSIE